MLYKCEKVESPLCYLCKADIETLEHFFFYCPRVRMFWNEVVNLFRDQLKISKDFEITDVIFGLSNKETYSSLINYIILEGKYLLYLFELNDSFLSPRLLLERIKNTYKFERFIARESNNLNYHYMKWEPLLPLISP